jgi:hypothetical protein
MVHEMQANLGLRCRNKLQREITVGTPTNCAKQSINDNKQQIDSMCHVCMTESFTVTMESM